MTRKLALKKLTASDLTFFQWHFENRPAGNQKSINLNADIFINVLYPSLPEIGENLLWRFPLDLNILGPGLHGLYNIQRKIIKGTSYKNWRLDGEFIFNPENSNNRFNILEPEDLVLFEFFGTVSPHSATALFVSRSLPEDQLLHTSLEQKLEGASMRAISSREISEVVSSSQINQNHPLHDFALEEAFEDAVQGGFNGVSILNRRPGRATTQEELNRARATANRVGRFGEELTNSYLSQLKNVGEIDEFEWVSNENVVAPYDFKIESSSNDIVLIDVKSTLGGFGNRIHLSLGELVQVSQGPENYRIYRLYEVNEDDGSGQLCISEDLRGFANNIIQYNNTLPAGVRPDSFSIDPSIIAFDEPVQIRLEDEEN